MSQADLARDLIATYRKHGWELRRLLVKPDRRDEILGQETDLWRGVTIQESTIDALWFSRPSLNGREAWELRLLAENPYALFETFESDEDEDLREEARLEMENRMREQVK
jgi:hypothetical protein